MRRNSHLSPGSAYRSALRSKQGKYELCESFDEINHVHLRAVVAGQVNMISVTPLTKSITPPKKLFVCKP